jgi:hypothetical protein
MASDKKGNCPFGAFFLQNLYLSLILYLKKNQIVGSERGALAAFSFNQLESTDCAKMDGENVVLDIGKVLAFAFIDCSSDSEANEGEEKSVMLFTLDGKRWINFLFLIRKVYPIFRRLQIHQFGPADQQPTLLTALSARVNEELLLQARLTELRADLFASSQHCGALAFCSHKALFVLKGGGIQI